MNYDQLKETTMDPRTRTLVKVNIEDAEEAAKMFSVLMGKDVNTRKEYIENNANTISIE